MTDFLIIVAVAAIIIVFNKFAFARLTARETKMLRKKAGL